MSMTSYLDRILKVCMLLLDNFSCSASMRSEKAFMFTSYLKAIAFTDAVGPIRNSPQCAESLQHPLILICCQASLQPLPMELTAECHAVKVAMIIQSSWSNDLIEHRYRHKTITSQHI